METQFCLYNNLVNFQPSDFCSNVFKSVPRKYLRYKDDLNILVNGIQPRKIMQHQTIKKIRQWLWHPSLYVGNKTP